MTPKNTHNLTPPGLLESVPGIAWATDRELRITCCCGAGLAALGLCADQVVGENLFEFFHTNNGEDAAIVAHRRAMAGEVVVFDQDFCGRLYQATVKPHRDEGGRIIGCIGIAQDMTERLTLEDKLRNQQVQLLAAQEIQSFLLPKVAPSLPGYDVAGRCFPAELAAGDHFDFLFLDNGVFVTVISDVSGHGIAPAILMASLHAHVRTLIAAQLSLREMVRALNSVLLDESPEQRFVTLFALALDGPQRLMSYVACGHPPGIIMDGDGEVRALLERGGIPLGIDTHASYQNQGPIPLSSGDVILLLTDGALEAEGADGVRYGQERVVRTLRENRHRSAHEIVNALHQSVLAFSRDEVFVDDVTLIVIKVDW